MKTIEFNAEQILALKNYERTGRVIAETGYGTINTHALDAKAVLNAYFEIYGQKVCTSCTSNAIAAIKKIYNDYDLSLAKPKKAVKKVINLIEVHEDEEMESLKHEALDQLREQYLSKYGKKVSNRYNNDIDWIKGKL